jgi:DNA (cytosine-5-)-methyltransferase
MKIVSFFAGAGGLDLGFERAGFEVIWANEYDPEIWATYKKNHPRTILDRRSITDIAVDEVPDCDGIIGGPPCQSWSEAGAKRGIEDKRGQLFFDFIRILKGKQPKFFLAENVSGMLLNTHQQALHEIQRLFIEAGYELFFHMVNVADYGIPQDRKRIFFVGIRKDLDINFHFPAHNSYEKRSLRDAIYDLKDDAVPRAPGLKEEPTPCIIPNHEYMTGGFSTIFMSRNRVRSWDEVSFTIQAGARHAPLHPGAPKMQLIEPNKRIFVPGYEDKYRRLSVRECARIQTFPDEFIFEYNNITSGYKMVGNAVPPQMANIIAQAIAEQIK